MLKLCIRSATYRLHALTPNLRSVCTVLERKERLLIRSILSRHGVQALNLSSVGKIPREIGGVVVCGTALGNQPHTSLEARDENQPLEGPA